MEQLRRVGANLLGLVLNGAGPEHLRYTSLHLRGVPYAADMEDGGEPPLEPGGASGPGLNPEEGLRPF